MQEQEPSRGSPLLEYTGERHMAAQPGVQLSLGHIDHMVRYACVAPFLAGKRVLDISCGSGYGTQYMAIQGASEVVGVDIDHEAIEYAQWFHMHTAVCYIESDVHSVSQLPDASFDVVVSFETMEHVERPRQFLLELRRLLKPGGQCFISVPNDYRVSPWISEFHRHKFTFTEFRDLITNIFGEATFLGQHNACVSALLRPVSASATYASFEPYRRPVPLEFFGDQYADGIGPIETALGYLAVVGLAPTQIRNQLSLSESAFQEVMAGYRFAMDEAKRARNEMAMLQESAQIQLQETQAHLVVAQRSLEELQREVELYRHERAGHEHWHAEAEAALARAHTAVTQWRGRVIAMESSKFWKLRQVWFRIKGAIGLEVDSYDRRQTMSIKEEGESGEDRR